MPALRWLGSHSRYRKLGIADFADYSGRVAERQHGFCTVPGAGGCGVVLAERKAFRDQQNRNEAAHQRAAGTQQNAGNAELPAGAFEARRSATGQHRSQLQDG